MFRFKQFSVTHSQSTMKVGTDAVLLGAWCPLPSSPSDILEIGTGCGVISLMLAQRSPVSHIHAIDLDAPSIEEASANFLSSPWADRLSASCFSVQEYAHKTDKRYDLIVSNPPYFRNSLRNPDPKRTQARHTDSLSFEDLIASSSILLNPNGILALVLPSDAEEEILSIAECHHLALHGITYFHTKQNAAPTRILLSLSPVACSASPLTSHLSLGSPEYQDLVGDFYL